MLSGLFRDYVEVLEDTGMVYQCKLPLFFRLLGEPDEVTETLPVTVMANVIDTEIVSKLLLFA